MPGIVEQILTPFLVILWSGAAIALSVALFTILRYLRKTWEILDDPD